MLPKYLMQTKEILMQTQEIVFFLDLKVYFQCSVDNVWPVQVADKVSGLK